MTTDPSLGLGAVLEGLKGLTGPVADMAISDNPLINNLSSAGFGGFDVADVDFDAVCATGPSPSMIMDSTPATLVSLGADGLDGILEALQHCRTQCESGVNEVDITLGQEFAGESLLLTREFFNGLVEFFGVETEDLSFDDCLRDLGFIEGGEEAAVDTIGDAVIGKVATTCIAAKMTGGLLV